jgi:predicted TPR repeat methyltransferase
MEDAEMEKLAEVYDRALALEKSDDHDGAAAAYREMLALDPEDHGGAAVRLAAMGRGPAPERAPVAYVATLFNQHAEVFDSILVDQLNYEVPWMVEQMLDAHEFGPIGRMLDLGCGTGLTGEAMRDRAAHVAGVDLAEDMVEIAGEKGDYDQLFVGDAVVFLEDHESDPWDLIVAADVLPYLGSVEALFRGAAARLAPGGAFVFSTERAPEGGPGFIVGRKHRFAHTEAHIRASLEAHGLEVLEVAPITVREDEGEAVAGDLVLARRG